MIEVDPRFAAGELTDYDRKNIDKGICPSCLKALHFNGNDRFVIFFRCNWCNLDFAKRISDEIQT